MKKNNNVKDGVIRRIAVIRSHWQFDRVHTTSYSFHRNYAPVLYLFQDSELFAKSCKFLVAHTYLTVDGDSTAVSPLSLAQENECVFVESRCL